MNLDTLLEGNTEYIQLEEGWTYWTHEGLYMRSKHGNEMYVEVLGPGGWSEAL